MGILAFLSGANRTLHGIYQRLLTGFDNLVFITNVIKTEYNLSRFISSFFSNKLIVNFQRGSLPRSALLMLEFRRFQLWIDSFSDIH